MGWIWILIPLTALSIPIFAIGSSVVEKYIKSQERQANLMTEEFMAEMMAFKEEAEAQQQMYEERIAKLEGMVSANSETEQAHALPAADKRYPMPDLEDLKDLSDKEKVAVLMEKLKG